MREDDARRRHMENELRPSDAVEDDFACESQEMSTSDVQSPQAKHDPKRVGESTQKRGRVF